MRERRRQRQGSAPNWLGRGTRASFEYKALHTREVHIRGTKANVVANAIVTEVSVLSSSTEPVEPLAEVRSYRVAEPPAVRSSADRPPAGGAATGDHESRLYAEQRAREGVIVRYGVGQVLGVR